MICFNRTFRILIPALVVGVTSAQVVAADQTVNFTGPLLTPNPMTLPAGSVLIEPYLMYYDSDVAYDNHGWRYQKESGVRQWQTLIPIYCGVTDRLQLQLSGGAAHAMSGGSHTAGLGATDTTIGAQYLLVAPNNNGSTPAISVNYQHRFPTGAYDKLNENPLNGTGNGASVDTFSLMAQQYVWLSNGRPLRLRAVVSYSLPPSHVTVNGVSVFNTPHGFHGNERLGQAVGVSTSVEYSIDSHWVLASDLTYNRTAPGQLTGTVGRGMYPVAMSRRDPVQSVFSVAPAVEYNFNDRIGVVGGVQVSFAGRNNDAFLTPMVAVNMIF